MCILNISLPTEYVDFDLLTLFEMYFSVGIGREKVAMALR